MVYLGVALNFFFLSVLTHVVWCRWRGIRVLALASWIGISLLFFILYGYLLKYQPRVFDMFAHSEDTTWGFPFKQTSLTLYVVFIPFYLTFYHSISIDSPTRALLDYLKKRGKVSYDELVQFISQNAFIESRFNALVKHHILKYDGQLYRLSWRGIGVAFILRLYQTVVQRPKGG